MKLLAIFIITLFLPIFAFAQTSVVCPVPSKKQGNVNHIFFSFQKKQSNLGSYLPKNLVLIDQKYLKNGPRCMTNQSYQAFKVLEQAVFDNTGENLVISSAWRSPKTQSYFAKTRAEFAASPGRSEHQLGTTIDIHIKNAPEDKFFGDTLAYKWMAENAHKYGFTQSFNSFWSESTGIPNEPWHFRFVGETIATKVKTENLNLDAFLQERKDQKAKR